MMSLLISCPSQDRCYCEVQKYLKKFAISPHDYLSLDEESMGIAMVRSIKHWVKQKPYDGSYRLVVIYGAQRLTIEAQNALLKLVEEPPQSLLVILTTTNSDKLLPTIISRLRVITLEPEVLSDNQQETAALSLKSLITLSIAEKLELASTIASSKESARSYLALVLHQSRQELIAYCLGKLNARVATAEMDRLHELLRLFKDLETNLNPRFVMETFLLNLKKD